MHTEKINIFFDTVYHTTGHYTAQLYTPFAITTSGFYFLLGIEKVFGSMKTLPVIQKKLVSPADFSTHPVGPSSTLEEPLVLSKIYM